ncbi:Peptidase OS=Streptomyces tendae OX=1932 GN=GUR47_14520 PE=4 SV=1 [Streptomyces tendae]
MCVDVREGRAPVVRRSSAVGARKEVREWRSGSPWFAVDRRVGDEHLLLALVLRPGVPAEVLADHGVTHASLTRVLGDGAGEVCA